jgi:hypothetical protein
MDVEQVRTTLPGGPVELSSDPSSHLMDIAPADKKRFGNLVVHLCAANVFILEVNSQPTGDKGKA